MPAFPSSDFITIGSGLNVAAFYPVDYRFVFANATDRLALSWYAAYEGLITYQQDTQELYVLINKGPEGAPTIGQNSSWRLVGGGSGTNYAAEWAFTNTLNQSFAFTGDGLPSPEDDPTLYLLRGQSYRFSNDNTLGTHPFQIQTDVSTVVNGGTPYNLGVTNNRASGSQQLIFDVPMSAPDKLYYQCTSHPAMSGSLIIVGNPGSGSAGSGSGFPFEGDAIITGSLLVSGSNVDFSEATALTASIISASGGITGSLKGIADTASMTPFNGNRLISNVSMNPGVKNVNYGGNSIGEFIENVFFTNTEPAINTSGFTIGEYLPSGSLVGTVTATDPEGQSMTFSTSSTYTDDYFTISSAGQVTMRVKSTASMNTVNTGSLLKSPFPVVVTDAGGLTGSRTLYIRVTPNTAPIWSITNNGNALSPNYTGSFYESSSIGNNKYQFWFRDDEGDSITINTGSLSSTFNQYFSLNVQSNYIGLNQIAPVDYDQDPVITFALTASDEHYISGDDPNSITFLPVRIEITDDLDPTIGDMNTFSINENSANEATVGTISNVSNPDGPLSEVSIPIFTLHSAYLDTNPSVNLTQSLISGGGNSLLNPSADPFYVPNANNRVIKRRSNVYLNSDIANRYVYRAFATDPWAPSPSASALMTINIDDDLAATVTLNDPWYILESARTGEYLTDQVDGYPNASSQYAKASAAGSVSQRYTINSTNDYVAATTLTGSSTYLELAKNISSSGLTPGTVLDVKITASENSFFTTKQFFDKSVEIKQMQVPVLTPTDIPSNSSTNGARPSNNLVSIDILDPQPYPIDHSTWTFTPNSGDDLIAVRNGSTDDYYVQANSNLPVGTYGYTASIFNDRGFASGSVQDTFNIVAAPTGSLNIPALNIIESATSGATVKTNNNGRTGGASTLGVSYPSGNYNNPQVASFTSSNAFVAVSNAGVVSITGNMSPTYPFPGNITSSITWQDQYGNIGGPETISLTIRENLAPTFNITNLVSETDDAQSGDNIVYVTNIQDVEQDLNYTVSLSGANAALFSVTTPTITTNGGNTYITAVNNLAANTYNFNVVVTDNFGSSRTTAHSITISQSAIYGPMYIYQTNMYTTAYNDGARFTNSPADGATGILQDSNSYPLSKLKKDTSGIDYPQTLTTFGSNFIKSEKTFTPSNSTPSVTAAIASGTNGTISYGTNTTSRYFILIPSGSSITGIPVDGMMQSLDPSQPTKGVMYINAGSGWGITNSQINLIDFGSSRQGYQKWYVIGTTGQGGESTTNEMQIRIILGNGTAPS